MSHFSFVINANSTTPRRYRDEDFDDSQMESDYRTVMREEFISKKLGLQEDLEDMRMEAEEIKRKQMRKKRKL